MYRQTKITVVLALEHVDFIERNTPFPEHEELCSNGTTEVLCDGLQIAFIIGNECADI